MAEEATGPCTRSVTTLKRNFGPGLPAKSNGCGPRSGAPTTVFALSSELDPLMATLILKALRDDHVALALVIWRQAVEVPEPHPKCGMKWGTRSPPPRRARSTG